MGEVILVASGKGGTGKTAVTANLGALLAKDGYKVALIDMDMGMRNLDLYLGLENHIVYNLMDVVTGICKTKRAFVKDRRFENLYLMSASPNKDERNITPLQMKNLCDEIRDDFDYVMIDCPAGIGSGVEVAMAGADRALLVTEPDMAALRDADIINRYLKQNGIANTCFIVNKVRADLMERKVIPDLNEISEMIRCRMIGIVQFDDNIYISTNRGIPIVFKKGTYIEENFQNIKRRFIACGNK